MNKRIPFNEYPLFAEAWLSLATARFMLVFFPFEKIVSFLKNSKQKKNIHYHDDIFFREISLSIGRASMRSPWRTKCFEQALAAKMMLKKRGLATIIHFGVCKGPENGKKLQAHAWLDCEGIRITGGKNVNQYTVIASFKS